MKARPDAIIQREQAEYLDRLIAQTDPLLLEMEAYGAEHRVPSADREVARFVEITRRQLRPGERSRLGWQSVTRPFISRARWRGRLVITIDPSEEMIKAADGYLERAGLRDRVRIERGKALEVIPRCEKRLISSSSTR